MAMKRIEARQEKLADYLVVLVRQIRAAIPLLNSQGEIMITLNGIRNGVFSAIAFGIVGCASTPMPVDKLAVAKSSLDRAEQAQAAQFAQVELNSARNKYAAAQAAANKSEAEVVGRLADQADVDAQLAEATARAKQQQQLVAEMEESLRDLRNETLRRNDSGAGAQAPQPTTTPPRP